MLTFETAMDLIRGYLLSAKGDWLGIARRTGLTYRWIRTFAQAQYTEVRIGSLELLARELGIELGWSVTAKAPRKRKVRR